MQHLSQCVVSVIIFVFFNVSFVVIRNLSASFSKTVDGVMHHGPHARIKLRRHGVDISVKA